MDTLVVDIFYAWQIKGWFWKKGNQSPRDAEGPYKSEMEAKYYACRKLGISYPKLLNSLRKRAQSPLSFSLADGARSARAFRGEAAASTVIGDGRSGPRDSTYQIGVTYVN